MHRSFLLKIFEGITLMWGNYRTVSILIMCLMNANYTIVCVILLKLHQTDSINTLIISICKFDIKNILNG